MCSEWKHSHGFALGSPTVDPAVAEKEMLDLVLSRFSDGLRGVRLRFELLSCLDVGTFEYANLSMFHKVINYSRPMWN